MSDFLQQMAASSAARAATASQSMAPGDFDKPVYPLRLAEFDLIAEIKNRSPAEGDLAANAGPREERAQTYADGGAAAISVLTEPERFDGHLSDLEEVVGAVSASETPVMRKDFLVDVVQVLEAKSAGASGVLLIAAILSDDNLRSLLDCAYEHDLFVLLESFNEADLDRSAMLLRTAKYREQAARNKFLLGINTRDLRSLAVDSTRLERFSARLPEEVICVAESGQHSPEDAARVSRWGYEVALVGTALMRSENPATLIHDMLMAGRANHA